MRTCNTAGREGGFLAEVPVALIEDDTAWSPCLTLDDCRKLDEVRLVLRRRDLPAAARHARLFALTPLTRTQPSPTGRGWPRRGRVRGCDLRG